MGTHLSPTRGDTLPLHADSRMQTLLRELIAYVRQTRSPESPVDSEQAVILDIEVDDVRCLLVQTPAGAHRSMVTLSPREKEIVRMVAAGYPNKTIAGVLDISCWTVSTHLRRVFAKLGVGSRAAMVARLLETHTLNDDRMNVR